MSRYYDGHEVYRRLEAEGHTCWDKTPCALAFENVSAQADPSEPWSYQAIARLKAR